MNSFKGLFEGLFSGDGLFMYVCVWRGDGGGDVYRSREICDSVHDSTRVRVRKNLDARKELKAASYEWTEYDDLPYLEDVSAFQADLKMDTVSKRDGQTLKNFYSEKCCKHQPSVTSDEMTSGKEMSDNLTSKMTTSQITSLNDEIFELTQTSKKITQSLPIFLTRKIWMLSWLTWSWIVKMYGKIVIIYRYHGI